MERHEEYGFTKSMMAIYDRSNAGFFKRLKLKREQKLEYYPDIEQLPVGGVAPVKELFPKAVAQEEKSLEEQFDKDVANQFEANQEMVKDAFPSDEELLEEDALDEDLPEKEPPVAPELFPGIKGVELT